MASTVTVSVEVFDNYGSALVIRDEQNRDTLYEYDWLDRLIQVISPDPDGAAALWHPVTKLKYTGTGRIEQEIRTSVQNPDVPVPVCGGEIVTRYEYDVRHRLQNLYENFYAYQVDAEHPLTQYAYDAAGNLTAVVDPLGRTTAYAYDQLDRPTRVTEPDPDGPNSPLPAPSSLLAYDPLGRLTAAVDPRGAISRYEYDEHHQLTRVLAALGATTEYAYDASGQLTAVTDAEGRTTGYAYDDAGRLAALLLPSPGSLLPASNPLLFQYDTAGNTRVSALTANKRDGPPQKSMPS